MKSANTYIRDMFLRNTINLDRFSNSVRTDIESILKKAQNEIITEIQTGDLTDWSNRRLTRLNSKINDIMKGKLAEVQNLTTSQLSKMAENQVNFTVGTLNKSVGVNLFDVSYSPEFLTTLVKGTWIQGGVLSDWINKSSGNFGWNTKTMLSGVQNQVKLGLLKGDAVDQIVRNIRGTPEIPGIVDMTRKEVKALVRTSVMSVANETRMNIYSKNADLINGYQVLATLDARTTPLCRALDGKQYDKNLKPIPPNTLVIKNPPPFHWMCRSTLLPLLKSFSDLTGKNSKLSKAKIKKLESLDVGKRASISGDVPANLTYNEWLKTQSVEVQQEVLGKGKWELWSQNKLDMVDLIKPDGSTLTNKELEVNIKKMFGVVKKDLVQYSEQKIIDLLTDIPLPNGKFEGNLLLLPDDFLMDMKKWEVVSSFPYSNSFYNVTGKTWKNTPEGTIRISDHWNFFSEGEIHCKTDVPVAKYYWTMAKYDNGVYKVIKTVEKKFSTETGKQDKFEYFYDILNKETQKKIIDKLNINYQNKLEMMMKEIEG